jgi:hypothetical protein
VGIGSAEVLATADMPRLFWATGNWSDARASSDDQRPAERWVYLGYLNAVLVHHVDPDTDPGSSARQ